MQADHACYACGQQHGLHDRFWDRQAQQTRKHKQWPYMCCRCFASFRSAGACHFPSKYAYIGQTDILRLSCSAWQSSAARRDCRLMYAMIGPSDISHACCSKHQECCHANHSETSSWWKPAANAHVTKNAKQQTNFTDTWQGRHVSIMNMRH